MRSEIQKLNGLIKIKVYKKFIKSEPEPTEQENQNAVSA
jgi:hypothetical protein